MAPRVTHKILFQRVYNLLCFVSIWGLRPLTPAMGSAPRTPLGDFHPSFRPPSTKNRAPVLGGGRCVRSAATRFSFQRIDRRQRNRQTNGHHRRVKPPLLRRGLTTRTWHTHTRLESPSVTRTIYKSCLVGKAVILFYRCFLPTFFQISSFFGACYMPPIVGKGAISVAFVRPSICLSVRRIHCE